MLNGSTLWAWQPVAVTTELSVPKVIHQFWKEAPLSGSPHLDAIATIASCKAANGDEWVVNTYTSDTIPIHPRLARLHQRALHDEEALELVRALSLLQMIGGVFLSELVQCTNKSASIVLGSDANKGVLLLSELSDTSRMTKGFVLASAPQRIEIDTLITKASRPPRKPSKDLVSDSHRLKETLLGLIKKRSAPFTNINSIFRLAV